MTTTNLHTLLSQDAILEAAHDLYCVAVNSRLDEIGERRHPDWLAFRSDVARLDDATQLSIMWRIIGRVEQAWGYDVGLVFHHMGATSEEDQQTALYYLVMGCLGHGVSLANDHAEALDKASEILLRYQGGAFDHAPIDIEGVDWMTLAEEDYPGETEDGE